MAEKPAASNRRALAKSHALGRIRIREPSCSLRNAPAFAIWIAWFIMILRPLRDRPLHQQLRHHLGLGDLGVGEAIEPPFMRVGQLAVVESQRMKEGSLQV